MEFLSLPNSLSSANGYKKPHLCHHQSPPEADTSYWKFTKHTIMQSYALHIPNMMIWLWRPRCSESRGWGGWQCSPLMIQSVLLHIYFHTKVINLYCPYKELWKNPATSFIWIHPCTTLVGSKHTWVSPLSMESTLYIITNVHRSPTLTIPPKIATMQCEDSTVDEDDLEPEAWSETTITNYRNKPAYMQHSM